MRFCLSRFTAILSVLLGVFCFFLFAFAFGGSGAGFASKEACAVLVVDAAEDDRFIRSSLELGGITGLISESSQEIPVDDFGSLKMVALDSFHDEIEAFDPRDTGFAAKLRSFFVRDGKRFFFLLVDNASSLSGAKLEKDVARLMGDIPFSFTVMGQKRSFFGYFALLAAACALALYFSRARTLLVYELPVLFAFGWAGPFAFILAALLAGIWELLREPLGELSAARGYERGAFDYAGTGFRGLMERIRPFRINCVLVLLFLFLFAGFFVTGGFPPVPLAAGCGCFFVLCFLAWRKEAERSKESRHVLFTPVPLFPLKGRTFSLFPLLLPFAAAAALSLILPFVFPAFSPSPLPEESPVDPRYFVSSADYNRNLAFQASFSYLPLDKEPGAGGTDFNREGYLRYYLGEDGLIAGSGGAAKAGVDQRIGNLSFPLEKLMRFLIEYSKPAGAAPGVVKKTPGASAAALSPVSVKEWVPMAIILTASALSLLKPGKRNAKKKKAHYYGDKRIAA